MIWSPSTTSPSAFTATHRSASPSCAMPRSASCSFNASRSGSRCSDPQPSLMLCPSGSALMTTTVAPAARYASGAMSEAAPFAQSTTTRIPSRLCGADPARCFDVMLGAVQQVVRPADARADRPAPVGRLRHRRLDLVLHPVAELVTASREQLDAVVGHRVVGGRQHHAQVRARLGGQVRDPRGGQHADPDHGGAGTGQARHHGRLQHLAAGPWVAAHHGERGVRLVRLGKHVRCRDSDGHRQLRAQVGVGQPPNAIGAEESTHYRPFPPKRCADTRHCWPTRAEKATAGPAQWAARPLTLLASASSTAEPYEPS